MRKTLILVRHGETNYNLEGKIAGTDDRAVLTEKGIEQAYKCKEIIDKFKNVTFSSSPAKRAVQTTMILNGGRRDYFPSMNMSPIDYGRLQGKRKEELPSLFGKTFEELKGKYQQADRTEERVQNVIDYNKVILGNKETDATFCIVSHASVLNTMIRLLSNQDPDYSWDEELIITNGEPMIYELVDGNFRRVKDDKRES